MRLALSQLLPRQDHPERPVPDWSPSKTTTTTAAAAPASVMCGPTHVDAWCGCVWTFGDGIIHPDAPSIQLHAINPLHCLFGIIDALKVNEGKTPRASRSLVVDNIDAGQRAVT